jgi:hypothetical protein
MYAFVNRFLQQQVKPCLVKLKADSDIDVQYYALEALDGMSSLEVMFIRGKAGKSYALVSLPWQRAEVSSILTHACL